MPEPRPERAEAGLQESLEWLAGDASQEALTTSLVEIQTGSWLGPGAMLAAELALLAGLHRHQEATVPSADEMAAHLAEDPGYATAAKIWIEEFAASPMEVYAVTRPVIGQLPKELQRGNRCLRRGGRRKAPGSAQPASDRVGFREAALLTLFRGGGS